MRPLLDDTPATHDNKCARHFWIVEEAMSDYDGSPVLHELLQRLLHLVFRFGIERGCSLIQDKDRRISDDRAGNCYPLFLPSGNSYATLAYHGVISLRHIP